MKKIEFNTQEEAIEFRDKLREILSKEDNVLSLSFNEEPKEENDKFTLPYYPWMMYYETNFEKKLTIKE